MDYNTGMREATEKGLQRGIEQGQRKKQIEIAKKMLNMKIPVEQIIEATGLSKEEIQKLF